MPPPDWIDQLEMFNQDFEPMEEPKTQAVITIKLHGSPESVGGAIGQIAKNLPESEGLLQQIATAAMNANIFELFSMLPRHRQEAVIGRMKEIIEQEDAIANTIH